MKVYVLESHADYEGSTLYGVFSAPEKAMKYAEKNYNLKDYKWVKSSDGYYMRAKYETLFVTEMEVQ